MYQVVKVLNNNVCMAKDDKGMECIVVGKGIGFGKRPGDIIEEDKLEKKYSMYKKMLIKLSFLS